MASRTPSPHPLAATTAVPSGETETTGLLLTIRDLRRKIRKINREHGRTSLTLHMTRLQLWKARANADKLQLEMEAEATHARMLYFQMRELMETANPGMTHGDYDEDYKRLIAAIRRLRGDEIVAKLDAENVLTAELMPRSE